MQPLLPHTAINLLIDHHCRCQAARAYAPDGLKRKQTVFRCVAFLDAQFALELFQYVLTSTNVTCSAKTYRNAVLAARLQAECLVERGHVVYLLKWNLERLGHGLYPLNNLARSQH